MRVRRSFPCCLLLLLPGWINPLPGAVPGAAPAIVLVVNTDNAMTQITKQEATNLFMGRQARFASGVVALPVEPVGDPELRSRFYRILVNAHLAQIRSYWARVYFGGHAQPPRQVDNAQEVLEVVRSNKGAIGFLEQSKVDRSVKTVLILDDAPSP